MPRTPLSWLWTAAMLVFAPAPVVAANEMRHFDIPAGRAPATLTEFARQAKVELLYVSGVVDGLRTEPVEGELAPAEALRRMLARTGLVVSQGKSKGALASIFFLRVDGRQSILTVFNFTDRPRSHRIPLARLGLDPSRLCAATDVIHMERQPDLSAGGITFSQPPHSVSVLRIVDATAPVVDPVVSVEKPAEKVAGQPVRFSALAEGDEPVLDWHWDFGDGVGEEGAAVDHAFTHAGDYDVTLTAVGVGGGPAEKRFTIRITGQMSPLFVPDKIRRGQPE